MLPCSFALPAAFPNHAFPSQLPWQHSHAHQAWAWRGITPALADRQRSPYGAGRRQAGQAGSQTLTSTYSLNLLSSCNLQRRSRDGLMRAYVHRTLRVSPPLQADGTHLPTCLSILIVIWFCGSATLLHAWYYVVPHFPITVATLLKFPPLHSAPATPCLACRHDSVALVWVVPHTPFHLGMAVPCVPFLHAHAA